LDVGYGEGHVDEVQQVQEGEGVEGAVEEARVGFAVLVAVEGAGFGVLEGGDVCGGG
jgi:hypothetical protein